MAQAGVGVGAGVGVRALGIVNLGLGSSNWRRDLTVGVAYGEFLPTDVSGGPRWDVELISPIGGFRSFGREFSLLAPKRSADGAQTLRVGHNEYVTVMPALIPFLTSFQEYETAERTATRRWIWGDALSLPPAASRPPPWWTSPLIHAFDVECHLFLGAVGMRIGFSPGQFVDFLLGWFGIDIAGDDARGVPEPNRGSARKRASDWR